MSESATMQPGTESTNMLARLQTEHVRLEQMLSLVEWQFLEILSADTFDARLALDAVGYLHRYLVVVHWPKEDALIERALDRRPLAKSVLAPFIGQDRTYFTVNSERLMEVLSHVGNEKPVRRDQLCDRGLDWAGQLRRLIQSEERGSYPWALQQLRESDRQELEVLFRESESGGWRLALIDDYRYLEERLSARCTK